MQILLVVLLHDYLRNCLLHPTTWSCLAEHIVDQGWPVRDGTIQVSGKDEVEMPVMCPGCFKVVYLELDVWRLNIRSGLVLGGCWTFAEHLQPMLVARGSGRYQVSISFSSLSKSFSSVDFTSASGNLSPVPHWSVMLVRMRQACPYPFQLTKSPSQRLALAISKSLYSLPENSYRSTASIQHAP